jgi:hypothetical protein
MALKWLKLRIMKTPLKNQYIREETRKWSAKSTNGGPHCRVKVKRPGTPEVPKYENREPSDCGRRPRRRFVRKHLQLERDMAGTQQHWPQ